MNILIEHCEQTTILSIVNHNSVFIGMVWLLSGWLFQLILLLMLFIFCHQLPAFVIRSMFFLFYLAQLSLCYVMCCIIWFLFCLRSLSSFIMVCIRLKVIYTLVLHYLIVFDYSWCLAQSLLQAPDIRTPNHIKSKKIKISNETDIHTSINMARYERCVCVCDNSGIICILSNFEMIFYPFTFEICWNHRKFIEFGWNSCMMCVSVWRVILKNLIIFLLSLTKNKRWECSYQW